MPEPAVGTIYDLGYRNYEGPRLGRAYAVRSLYLESLRSAFGFGRRTSAKVFPFGLTVLAAFPAIVQVVIGTLSNDVVEVFRAEEYYTYIQVILALFCAAVAPELVGRDQRHQTLVLYFSRALTRDDYAIAKFAAMVTVMLALTVGPQAILFLGNGLAGNDVSGYFREEWDQVVPIVLSGALVSLLIGSIGIAIAAQTPRRAFATIGILGPFVILVAVTGIVIESIDIDTSRWAIFLSPFHVMEAATLWLFDAPPGFDSQIARADFPGWSYAAVALGVSGAGFVTLLRRYRRMAV
ncbi:MAG: ABC transporter permease [Dehalococcoidia bacterium]